MTVRGAYKVEELLALRHSASESAVSLDKFRAEDVIKEHVLKPSASNPGLSTHRENIRPVSSAGSHHIVTEAKPKENATAGSGSAGKKPSPTPSVKRGKAQRLLNEHGSPPGVRVTAGGRIVTTDFTPLGSPRYMPPHIQRQRTVSRPPYPQHSQEFAVGAALPNGYVAYNIEGQLCQMVNGNLMPLQITPQGPLLFMPSPNYPFPPLPAAMSAFGTPASACLPVTPYNPEFNRPTTSTISATSVIDLPGIDVETQIQLLQKQYDKLKEEKIEHERREVKIKDKLPLVEREMMIQQKRQYITDLDKIRKTIKQLEESMNPAAINPNQFRLPHPSAPPTVPMPYYPIPPQAPAGPEGPFWASMNAYNHMAPYGSDFHTFAALNNQFISPHDAQLRDIQPQAAPIGTDSILADQIAGVQEMEQKTPSGHEEVSVMQPTTTETSPVGQISHAPRKSHAIPIKDPRTGFTTNASVLDPTSPAYEPNQRAAADSESQNAIPGPPASPVSWHERHAKASASPAPQDNKNSSPPVPDATAQPNIEDTLRSMLASDERRDNLRAQHDSKASLSSVATADFFPVNTQEHSFSRYMERVFANRTNSSSGEHVRPSQNITLNDSRNIGYPNATLLPSPNSPFELRPLRAPQPSPVNARVASISSDTAQTLEIPIHLDVHFRQGNLGGYRTKENSQDLGIAQLGANGSHGAAYSNSQRSPNNSFETPEEKNEYFDGYRAGSAGDAPRSVRSAAYVSGYCDGLMKARASTSGRSLSTISVRSEAVPPAAAPPSVPPPQLANGASHPFEAVDRIENGDSVNGTKLVHRENVRTASQAKSFTPTKHQAWVAGCTSSPSVSAVVTKNNGFQQRVLSGSLRAFESTPCRTLPAIGGHSDGSTDSAVPVSTTKLYHEAVQSTNGGPPLTERSINLMDNSRSIVGSTWVQTELGILRVDEAARQLQHKMRPSLVSSTGHPTRTLSLSYDGALDDLKALGHTNPGNVTSAPSTISPGKTKSQPQMPASSPAKRSQRMSSAMATAVTESESSHGSPSKSNSPRRHSPTKARLGHAVRSIFSNRTAARDSEQSRGPSPDPAKMNAEEKRRWRQAWKDRFAALKEKEQAEVDEYRRNNPLPDDAN